MNRFTPYLVGIFCVGVAHPLTAQEQADRTLLAVFAHADDEFIVSPLLARYAREGADVDLAIVTRGEQWAPQTDLSPGDQIAAVRAIEALCAAADPPPLTACCARRPQLVCHIRGLAAVPLRLEAFGASMEG